MRAARKTHYYRSDYFNFYGVVRGVFYFLVIRAPTPQIPGTDASDKEKKKKKKKDKKDKKEKKEKSKLESGVDEKKKKKDKKDGKPDELCENELEGYIEKKEAKKEKKEQRSKMASEAFDGTKRSRKFGTKILNYMQLHPSSSSEAFASTSGQRLLLIEVFALNMIFEW